MIEEGARELATADGEERSHMAQQCTPGGLGATELRTNGASLDVSSPETSLSVPLLSFALTRCLSVLALRACIPIDRGTRFGESVGGPHMAEQCRDVPRTASYSDQSLSPSPLRCSPDVLSVSEKRRHCPSRDGVYHLNWPLSMSVFWGSNPIRPEAVPGPGRKSCELRPDPNSLVLYFTRGQADLLGWQTGGADRSVAPPMDPPKQRLRLA